MKPLCPGTPPFLHAASPDDLRYCIYASFQGTATHWRVIYPHHFTIPIMHRPDPAAVAGPNWAKEGDDPNTRRG